MKWLLGLTVMTVISVLAFSLKPAVSTTKTQDVQGVYQMPKPSDVARREKQEIQDMISRLFAVKVPDDARFQAAGAYRFVGAHDFLYIDRTDVGSVAFARSDYGDPYSASGPKTFAKELLLKRVQSTLQKTDLDVANRKLAEFQDEFAGAVQPKRLPKGFDPRKASKLVARTLNFERIEDGIPFFGSELLIGLNPDGSIGRLRKHWPKVDENIVEKASELQKAVRSGQWKVPAELHGEDIKILEMKAGVGHSAFADPGFRAEAVVRVLFHKNPKGTPYPIPSTGYKYFDAAGREVVFSKFPEAPASTRSQKYK
jgi:hypothetical protein